MMNLCNLGPKEKIEICGIMGLILYKINLWQENMNKIFQSIYSLIVLEMPEVYFLKDSLWRFTWRKIIVSGRHYEPVCPIHD